MELKFLNLIDREDINKQDIYGNNFLIDACYYNYPLAVDVLLKRGINFLHQNNLGYSALIAATINSNVDIVKRLLQYIKNNTEFLELKDFNGHTAMEWALENGASKIVKLLFDAGARFPSNNLHNYFYVINEDSYKKLNTFDRKQEYPEWDNSIYFVNNKFYVMKNSEKSDLRNVFKLFFDNNLYKNTELQSETIVCVRWLVAFGDNDSDSVRNMLLYELQKAKEVSAILYPDNIKAYNDFLKWAPLGLLVDTTATKLKWAYSEDAFTIKVSNILAPLKNTDLIATTDWLKGKQVANYAYNKDTTYCEVTLQNPQYSAVVINIEDNPITKEFIKLIQRYSNLKIIKKSSLNKYFTGK